jgi:CheY-like chemotaxis protein
MKHHPIHILIIEDEDLLAAILQDKLAALGFSVSRAADGEAALASVRERAPDMIVTDILLPVLDGRTLIKTLKTEGFTMPIIAITNLEDLSELQELLTGPHDLVLKKTYQTLEELLDLIQKTAHALV